MALMLMALWFILNGRIALDTALTGAGATVIVLAFCYFFGGWSFRKEFRIYRLLKDGILYFGYLVKEIFKANIDVIKIIFKKNQSPCIRTFATPLSTKAGRVMLANSITLTPGTVTVQLVDNALTVHCLTKEMADSLVHSGFETRLLKMEEKFDDTSV